MAPTIVDMVTTVITGTDEKCIRFCVQVFDEEQLRNAGGKVGDAFACDVQVRIQPANAADIVHTNTKNPTRITTKDGSPRLLWSGATRTYQLGETSFQKSKMQDFDSDTIFNDVTDSSTNSTGNNDVPSPPSLKEVTKSLTSTERIMDSIAKQILALHGKPESHPAIPALIRDIQKHMPNTKRKLLPKDVVSMRPSQALNFARQTLLQRTMNKDHAQLEANLLGSTPAQYRKGRVSFCIERRAEMFALACEQTMMAAINTAVRMYCVETAYLQLREKMRTQK